MQTRQKSLQRIALLYTAVKHAQALKLEQAAAAVRAAESIIAQRERQAMQSSAAARAALDDGQHLEWRMQASQTQFTEWNAQALLGLKRQREALMLEAEESYRGKSMQLEQIESVLRELRLTSDTEQARRMQRDGDDRFLAQQWWRKICLASADQGEHDE